MSPSPKPVGSVVRDEARPSGRLLAVVLVVFTALLYSTAFLDQRTAEWLIREEHPIELLGALSLLAASIASFLLWRAVRGDPAWPRPRRWGLFALGLLFFYGAGEEESWGQRLLGIQTPTSIARVNEQHEINTHNLTVFSGINSNTLFSLLWLVIGVVVPVLAMWPGWRRRLARFLPILPVALSGPFVVNQLLLWCLGAFFARYPAAYHSRFPVEYTLVEIKETVASLLLAAGFILVWRQYRRTAPGPPK